MATTLAPLQTAQIHSPPADNNTTTPRRSSLISQTQPTQTGYDRLSRRASNRFSWSSTSNISPVLSASPTTSDPSASPSRKLRLPVRVSRTQTSFTPSSSSPESRRRSVSVASDTKRPSRSLLPHQLEEDGRIDDKSEPKDSPTRTSTPPPAYRPTTVVPISQNQASVSQDDSKKSSPSSSTPKDPSPPAYNTVTSPQPAQHKEPSKSSAQISQSVTTVPHEMSSAASSPDAQKTAAMTNAGMGNRGFDFAVGNGNTKLTAQSGNGLPLPGLSGKGNGPVGNLLRGPVDEEGNLKAAALTVGIKLDLEAEVHLSARVRGDILVGLY